MRASPSQYHCRTLGGREHVDVQFFDLVQCSWDLGGQFNRSAKAND